MSKKQHLMPFRIACQRLLCTHSSAMNSSEIAFRNLEHVNWEKAVAAYDQGFGPLTRQCIPSVLAAVRSQSGMDVLDVATGPGFAAQAAAEKGCNVVAIDFSAKMLQLAQNRLSETALPVQFKEADATSLPSGDSTFDAVISNFGVLHLATPQAFFAESSRVLRPGGRLAFTVWATPPATEAFELILGAVKKRGNPDVPLPPGPPFFKFAERAVVEDALSSAGFMDIGVQEVPQTWRLPSATDLFVTFRDGTGRTAALLAGQTPQQLKDIENELIREVEARKVGGQVELNMPCVLASATKPAGGSCKL